MKVKNARELQGKKQNPYQLYQLEIKIKIIKL